MSEIKVFAKDDLELSPDVPGANMWAVGLEKAMLTYFELEPNTVFPEHSHEAEQITLVLEGELTFAYDGKEVILKTGDVIAIPSNMVHSAYTGALPCKAVDAWSPPRSFLARIEPVLREVEWVRGAFNIRPAAPEDMPFIEDCIEKFRLDDEELDYKQSVVALEGNDIVGFGRIRPHKEVYELGSVGVVENWRNHGIGRLIVEHLISRFPSDEVYITTDLPEYFERFGFKKMEPGPKELTDKLQRVCKSKCRENALVMVKKM